jgi:microcystin-dependent protein
MDRAPRQQGSGPGLSPVFLGEAGGAASQTLTSAQVPTHSHSLLGSTSPAVEHDPGGNLFATPAAASPGAFATGATGAAMGTPPAAAPFTQPHENMQPSLALNFCIALRGIFPPRP